MEWQTKQIRRTYNRLGLGMLAYLLIYQFLSLPLMLLVKLLCPRLLSSSWFGLLLGELVQYAIALPVCWWIAKSANTPQRPLSRRKLSVSCFFKYLLLSIGLLFLFNLIGTAVNELLSQLKGSPAGNLVEQSVSSYTLWQMVLVRSSLRRWGRSCSFVSWSTAAWVRMGTRRMFSPAPACLC